MDRPPTPPAAVLLRLPVEGPAWVRALPPVPRPHTVTVTVSHPRLAAVPADDLVSRGYRIAGIAAGGPLTVGVLVPDELARAEPTWFSELLRAAARAFDCSYGPVRAVFADELALHQRALEHP